MALTAGQQKCVETFGKPLVVAAGAGSGKTFTLTRRVVNAFDAGQVDDIDQVLAITFTEKAAAELKSRIKGSLRAAGRIDQTLKVDDAWISTIHGACSRILREHALELDIDPLFKIMPDDKRGRALDRAIQSVITDPSDAGVAPEDVRALFAEYGRGEDVADMIRKFVQVMQTSIDGPEAITTVQTKGTAEQLVRRLLANVRAQYELLCPANGLPSKAKDSPFKLEREQQLADAIDKIDIALSTPEQLTVERALELADLLPKTSGRIGTQEYRSAVNELINASKGIVGDIAALVAQRHLATLIALAGHVLARFSHLKLAEGYLDNNDLVVLCARALRDHPVIAAQYADRFKLVMVDEFQDTDQLQVDMIKRMAGTGCERLCTVGDAQQSIYRFRGADLNVYRNHLKLVQERDADGCIELFDNFRSHGDVLAFVDRVFSQPEGFGEEFKRLVPQRDEDRVAVPFLGSGPRVMVDLSVGSKGTPGAGSDELLAARAETIARRFSAFRDAGHRAGDMVVLLGRMTVSGVYAKALRDAGFDVVVAGGSVFKDTVEPALVCALARCIGDMGDSEALGTVLTSDLFGLDDRDLVLLCTGEREGKPARRDIAVGVRGARELEGLSPRALQAIELLFQAAGAARREPLSTVLERVLVDSGWVSRCEARGPEGQAAAANALKAVRMVADIEDEEHCGALEVARRFASRLEAAKEAPGALSATGGDFVRIMTVHAAKGLEFPIVAVAEVGKNYRSDKLVMTQVGRKTHVSLAIDPARHHVSDKGLVSEAVKGSSEENGSLDPELLDKCVAEATTPFEHRAAIIARERFEEGAESLRLLYVALTRAKEAVVLVLSTTSTKKDPLGCSKGMPALLQGALFGPTGTFAPGTTMVDIGGEQLLQATYVTLVSDDDESQGAEEDVACGQVQPDDEQGLFFFPDPPQERVRIDQAWRTPGVDLKSYSSLAQAGAHPQALYDRVEAEPVVYPKAEAAEEPVSVWPRISFTFDDLDYELVPIGIRPDSDDATDFGSAFHLLAQMAARAHVPGQPLAKPAVDRIAHVGAVYGLGEQGLARLDMALDHWFASDAASQAAACESLGAEVPFAFAVDDGRWTIEGSIDLLGLCESGDALVVDYKTGGSDDETPERLRAKHALQGAVYATSVLLQGLPAVDLAFVRVEREDADAPGQPQVVRYRYTADDLPWLFEQLVEACEQAEE